MLADEARIERYEQIERFRAKTQILPIVDRQESPLGATGLPVPGDDLIHPLGIGEELSSSLVLVDVGDIVVHERCGDIYKRTGVEGAVDRCRFADRSEQALPVAGVAVLIRP